MKTKKDPAKKLLGIEVFAMLALTVILLSGVWAQRTQTALAEKVVRLHVLAHSDTQEDQALKLAVRDAVLEEAETLLESAENCTQAQRILRNALPALEAAAAAEIAAQGYGYSVCAQLEQTAFPTRQYGSFALPAGEYLALRIIIGEGQGKNWWCVVYPALCLGIPTADAAAAGFSDEEISLITEDTASVRLRFRLLEILCRVRIFAKNEKQ